MRQWLAFLKSERKSIVSDIPIVVVGNKRTGDNPDNSIDPLGAFRIYIAQLVKEFTGIFRLAGVVEMDCKKGQSQAMNLFRCELKRIKDCRSLILNYFIGDNRFLKLEEFRSIVEHRLRRPLIRDLPIKLLAQNLHDSGTVS